ncbi:hypothetical protein BCR22_02655 [Enterococcus plantarum]|uniref:hypothetical protein n=1 Tax=Enterococcus plantarum TaxID=1077675 RepID=UPI00084E0A6E|nr:hypothetical protein [Enterococcus plantarum]MBO0468897.1 hypothetical protein [Enterococcus plantarum]OEG17576.1 hypothetical protein BCR22_02655 [Enterococcus plantarum]
MYQKIYSDTDGHMIFYNEKEKKLAELKLNSTNNNATTSKSNFGIIALVTTLLGNSVLGKLLYDNVENIPLLIVGTYLFAIFTALLLMFFLNKHQRKTLEKNQISFSYDKLKEIVGKRRISNLAGLIKLASIFFFLGVTCTIIFYFMHVILFLIFSWLCIFVSVVALYEPFIYFTVTKKLIKTLK